MKLAKWQGLGNDYLVIEESALPSPLTPATINLLCNRHLGVGSDGILLRCPPTGAVAGAVVRMRVFNPDGCEPEMCGNGIRIFARYLLRSGALGAPGAVPRESSGDEMEFIVETLAGPIKPRILGDRTVRVDMGRARFSSSNIDATYLDRSRDTDASPPESGSARGGRGADRRSAEHDGGSEHDSGSATLEAGGDVVDAMLQAGGQSWRFTFVDLGNPHCVIFVADPATFDVAGVGAIIERHPIFPNRANIEFAHVEGDGSVRMRVWERGVGETQACGTGATAVGAACVRLGVAESPVLVHLLGGDLTIEVGGGGAESPAASGQAAEERGAEGLKVFMTGPAEEVFSCRLADDLLRRLGWPAAAEG